MPIQTPFHSRTSALNHNLDWKDWGGYFAANSYNVVNDFEYFAFRHSAGLVDVTPLFKYEITCSMATISRASPSRPLLEMPALIWQHHLESLTLPTRLSSRFCCWDREWGRKGVRMIFSLIE